MIVNFKIIGFRCVKCCDLWFIKVKNAEELSKSLKWHTDHIESLEFEALIEGHDVPCVIKFGGEVPEEVKRHADRTH